MEFSRTQLTSQPAVCRIVDESSIKRKKKTKVGLKRHVKIWSCVTFVAFFKVATFSILREKVDKTRNKMAHSRHFSYLRRFEVCGVNCHCFLIKCAMFSISGIQFAAKFATFDTHSKICGVRIFVAF